MNGWRVRRWVESLVGFVALAGLAMISGPAVPAVGDPLSHPFNPCPGFISEARQKVERYTELPVTENVYCVGRISEEDPLGDSAVFGVGFEDVDTGNVWIVVLDQSDEMSWESWLEDNGWGDAVPTAYGYSTSP